MTSYKLILSYNGYKYYGWQIQNNSNFATIQGELDKALEIIFKCRDFKTMGSSRTDAGVHALHQVVKVEAPFSIEAHSLLKAINTHLPSDVRVRDCYLSDENWHPIADTKNKEYKYLFTNQEILSPFQEVTMPNVKGELNIDLMQKACALFLGEHDFFNYYCEGTDVKSTVRTIYECEINIKNNVNHIYLPASYYELRINGSGFLKQMVRLIVGAIWNIGLGKISLQDIEKSFLIPSETRLGIVAPAHGLYLTQINY